MQHAERSSAMMLHVGTCGFSYKDWIGPFYPNGTKAGAMLEFYAERFDAVEIDSTYYAIPKPALFDGMARRTPPGFRFCVKAPGSITHLPTDAEPARSDLTAFRGCLQALVKTGKLAAVLAQFPGSFRPSPAASARLRLMRERWPDVRLVAEFRHREWQHESSIRELRALDIGWCNVDEPRLESLMRPSALSTSDVGYIRFHGRNAAKWWKQERSPAERYDYSYSEAELTDWLPRIAQVSERATQTYVFFNNHRNGQAATNARQVAVLLGLGRSGPIAAEGPGQLSLMPVDEHPRNLRDVD